MNDLSGVDGKKLHHQWQPIETAPKDGQTIIVGYGRQSGFPVKVVWWDRLHKIWSHYGKPELGLEYNATHWVPLPPTPESKDEVL